MILFKKSKTDSLAAEEAGFYDVCEWWIENYPDDIFINEPKEVVEIRKLMVKILDKRKK